MQLSTLKSNIKTLLESTTGVTKWDTIQFSMLPSDAPKGYFQLNEITYGAMVSSDWLVGIGVASTSLSDLESQVFTILEAIENQFYYPNPCLAGGGIVNIQDSIQVEIPDTYANQSGITATDGFRTAITFMLTVKYSR